MRTNWPGKKARKTRVEEEDERGPEISGNVGSIGKVRLQSRLGCSSFPSHHNCIAFIVIVFGSLAFLVSSTRTYALGKIDSLIFQDQFIVHSIFTNVAHIICVIIEVTWLRI